MPTESFDASIHSVFQSSINLRLDKAHNLLTLFASTEGDLPQGIRMDAPKGFSFEDFQAGEPALCRHSILHFENHSLTIQLHGARRWTCNLPALEFDATNPAISAAWTCVWDALNKRQRHLEADIIAEELFRWDETARVSVLRKAGEAIRDLLSATRRYQLTDTAAVHSLIGLGSGLTPAGDDLLVGYMAGLWCALREESAHAQFISNLGQRIIDISPSTNDISRTYLYHAVRGQVSSRLADLAAAIARGENAEQLLETAEAAMQVGHTSGMDTVTGLLAGLAAWEGNDLLSI